MSIVVLKPNQGHRAYAKAAEVFAHLYEQVTGRPIPVTETNDGISDLIVIGSDAVNDFVMNEVLQLRLNDLGIRYGTDDYCIRSHRQGHRRILILAGGRGRSTLYAVYAYFEQFLGCRYFWDGDVIPHHDDIPMDNLQVVDSPRFDYRGLRYFAHRGLKRFQAEHWSLDDWKRELDWMTKKKLNFFMLRIGMDDIWQRAFPDDVPYPEAYQTITGIDAQGFDDRTDFWTLQYRGELKIKVLEYAKELDLMYPTDCGTMTHWYSRTPEPFLQSKTPAFCTQEIEQYTKSDTGRVFDFTKKENMDYYMHLTETMVEQHEKDTALFHTIGLGERTMYRDKRKNFALKQIAYRRIAENIRLRYPHSKLMLASWDFAGCWSPEEVRALMKELDHERTIVLDYTSETNDPAVSFLNWDVVGKFPWIFGLFHAYESESELRGPYDRSDERLKVAAADPYCKGFVLWPELSHSDPLVLEYLAHNAWSPLKQSVEELLSTFCRDRYGAYAEQMNTCWQRLLPFIKLGDWSGHSRRTPDDESYVDYYPGWHSHQDIWTKPLHFLSRQSQVADHLIYFDRKIAQTLPTLDDAIAALRALAVDPAALNDRFVLRDAVDMARTVLGRLLNFLWIRAFQASNRPATVDAIRTRYMDALETMAQLLSINPDFSLLQTLRDVQATAPTNPAFETTLKRNIGNDYCSQPAFELVAHPLKEEAAATFDYLIHKQQDDAFPFLDVWRDIFTRFEQTPLTEMQPICIPQPDAILMKVAACADRLREQL